MELIKDKPLSRKDLIQPLADLFNLTEEEINQSLPSGYDLVFPNRIAWALSYLFNAGLASKPQRGYYQLSENGFEYLKNNIPTKTTAISKKPPKVDKSNLEELTPQEVLDDSFNKIKESTYKDIISTIRSKSPKSFEELVVRLLQKMGYGDKIKNSGLVTKYTNDGGIDGIIKEDILGFGRIHIQAKRYDEKNTIQRDEIQKFVGALAGVQSNKGVFITTSSFTKGAVDYVDNLNNSTNIILIDGKMLAEYIYEFNLGMQTVQTIEIKKMDSDFWDEFL